MLTVSEVIKTVDSDEEIFESVEMCLNDFKNNFCRLGFMLRVLKERGYDNAYLMDRFGLSKSTINCSIQINEQFSENGYSYKLDEKYSDFKKSQLIEMLPLSQEQREEVSADMSVADIRDLKNDDYDDVEEDPVEEQDALPEFTTNDRWVDIRAAIACALSNIPEVGRNINNMMRYLIDLRDKKLEFKLDGINFYLDWISPSYGYIRSDEVTLSCGYFLFYNFYSYPEVMEYSDCGYFSRIGYWDIRNYVSDYVVGNFRDWEYLYDHFDNIPKALFDNSPMEFKSDKFNFLYGCDSLTVSYLECPDVSYDFKVSEFENSIENKFFDALEELFKCALSDNLKNLNHIFSIDDSDLYLCDKNNRLFFIFSLDKSISEIDVFGLSGSDFEDGILELINLSDYFCKWDASAIDMFFLLCTGKRVQYAIDTYWKAENTDK